MVCTENMFPLELYREQVWTPGKLPSQFYNQAPEHMHIFSPFC